MPPLSAPRRLRPASRGPAAALALVAASLTGPASSSAHEAIGVPYYARDADGGAIGTGRLLVQGKSGHIGRMAVLADWRGKGVGRALLERLLEEAATLHLQNLALHSQTQACGFYRGFGFVEEGPEYMEAGIPHRTMVRS